MINSACNTERYTAGPSAYDKCAQEQLRSLEAIQDRPNLAIVSREEQTLINSACNTERYTAGPAAFYRCVSRQLGTLATPPEQVTKLGASSAITPDAVRITPQTSPQGAARSSVGQSDAASVPTGKT